MHFLLLVQKKVPNLPPACRQTGQAGKSTPATIPIAIGTAVAGRRDLASVLLLTELNNSYRLHILNLKRESHTSCLMVNSKGACLPVGRVLFASRQKEQERYSFLFFVLFKGLLRTNKKRKEHNARDSE
ncbi:MAG TPA: hypothetical protein VFT15_09770 [Chitinophagaceae bacterium]|nr:hypothetical protein [Chitinophagaceae bacterium]